jgi:hypothetical protein
LASGPPTSVSTVSTTPGLYRCSLSDSPVKPCSRANSCQYFTLISAGGSRSASTSATSSSVVTVASNVMLRSSRGSSRPMKRLAMLS